MSRLLAPDLSGGLNPDSALLSPLGLAYAQAHGCASLLYVNLKRHGLLARLPTEMAVALKGAYRRDTVRYLRHRHCLRQILALFERAGIETLLLKGAATFCDDLYGDSGARAMGDLDILVPESQKERARRVLLENGFREECPPAAVLAGDVFDRRHHHLPPFYDARHQVVIELHYRVCYGQGNRILPTARVWGRRQTVLWEGQRTAIPAPTERVLHNVVHALKKEYLTSRINLMQMAEFAWLVARYREWIDWQALLSLCERQGFRTPLLAYAVLAGELFGTETPLTGQAGRRVRWNARRLLMGLRFSVPVETAGWGESLWRMTLTAYYRLNMLPWAWRNICYAPGWQNLPARVVCLLRKLPAGLKAWGDPDYDSKRERL
ncbi:nucleotidyltransferase domain-containing protein [Methylomarinovum tepidoasis]|uniref:nucleotidyltransferase domain-containing protein n=1 Tax=Methylomarinovum tepidoasis TaxID=2840183 RepID=UPI0025734552|nr:nucleotidyltransferase family protein [Methylomarinovum sp. IN45]